MKNVANTLSTLVVALLASAPLAVVADNVNHHEAFQLQEAGTIQSFQALGDIVLGLHPGATITDTELEQEFGRYIYEVELRDASGLEWDVYLDAATGEIMKNVRDD
jgi:uncharacterized membrane protein YkoI